MNLHLERLIGADKWRGYYNRKSSGGPRNSERNRAHFLCIYFPFPPKRRNSSTFFHLLRSRSIEKDAIGSQVSLRSPKRVPRLPSGIRDGVDTQLPVFTRAKRGEGAAWPAQMIIYTRDELRVRSSRPRQ